MTRNSLYILNTLTSYTGNSLCARMAAIILFVFSGMLATAEAQTRIQGVVIDDNENPVEGAAVILMQLPDSTYVAGTVTDETGSMNVTAMRLTPVIFSIREASW